MSGLTLPYASKLGKTFAQLAKLVTPPSGDTPEFVPAVFYDTQTYTSASTTSLNYFTAVAANPNLSNMDLSGSFPQPQYFEIHKLFVEILNVPTYDTAASAAGSVLDIAALMHSGAGIAQISIAGKSYPAIPLTFCGRAGGPVAAVTGTLAAGGKLQYGTSESTGGFPVNGSIIIPPLTKFGVTLQWGAAQTLSANVAIRTSLMGVLYRAVR